MKLKKRKGSSLRQWSDVIVPSKKSQDGEDPRKQRDHERAAMKKLIADMDALSPALAMLDWDRGELNILKNGINRALTVP